MMADRPHPFLGPNRDVDPLGFVRANAQPLSVPLLDELTLYLAHEMLPLWQLTEQELTDTGLPPPFWAFAWAGGQALARYVLDHPEIVANRRVLDFATGSGLVAIAAARAGARSVLASDLDALAVAACELNAELNEVELTTTTANVIGHPSDEIDVILAGDVFYEQPMADDVHAWFSAAHANGTAIFVGDPGRSYFPNSGLEKLETYSVITTRELEDSDVRRTAVWRYAGDR